MPSMNPPYKLFSEDPNLKGLMDLYKVDLKAFQDAEKEEYNRAKSTVSSLIDSYHKTNSQSLQESIINSMKRYQTVLPGHLKTAIQPYIAHGPTSPTAEKRRQYTQQFKRPEKPILNEAPGDSAEWENMQALVKYGFANADYDRNLTSFMVGNERAPDKLSFIPLPNGGGAVRGKDDRITYLTQQDLGLKDLSEKTGIPIKDILLNPNGVPMPNVKSFMNVNGRQIAYQGTFKPWAEEGKQYGQQMTGVTKMPGSSWDIEHPANLTKFLMEWKRKSPDDDFVKQMKDLANGNPKEANAELQSLFPSYSFKFIKRKENLWQKAWNMTPFFSSDEAMAIIPIPGKPIVMLDKAGKKHIYYYSADKDVVFNNIGEPLNSYAGVEAELNSRIIKK